MSLSAEQWLAAQEVALLEASYQLQSPPEREDACQPIGLEAQTVRAVKSRRSSAASHPNSDITG